MAKTKIHGEYLDASVISGQTQVTAVGADSVLIFDATDNALKKALLSDVIETVADGDITSAKLDTNIDIAGTFDVTGATTLDSTLTVAGDANFDSGTLFVDVSTDKVGIGTTAPDDYWSTASNLVVKQSSGNGGISIVTGTSEVGQLYFADGTSGDAQYRGWLNYSHADDKMALATAASIRMTILSDGKVGIGTSANLERTLTINTNLAKTSTTTAYPFAIQSNESSSNGRFSMHYTGGASAADRKVFLQMEEDGVANAGQIHLNPHGGTVHSPQGIVFGTETTAAYTLDDYEEGTWSPNLIGTTGSAGTYARGASYDANYTKVGRLVTIQCTFYITNKGSYTGKTRLTGLPYANAESTSQLSLGSFPDSTYGTTSGNVLIAAAVEAGQDYIGFFDGARLDPRHDYADVGTGYYVNLSGSYMAAT